MKPPKTFTITANKKIKNAKDFSTVFECLLLIISNFQKIKDFAIACHLLSDMPLQSAAPKINPTENNVSWMWYEHLFYAMLGVLSSILRFIILFPNFTNVTVCVTARSMFCQLLPKTK